MTKVNVVVDQSTAKVARKWDELYGRFRKAIISAPRTSVFIAGGVGGLLGLLVGALLF